MNKKLLHTLRLSLISLCILFCNNVFSQPANLVSNGNFGTGDFSGWTLSGAPDFRDVVPTPDPTFASTPFLAALGPVGGVGTISQALPTIVGAHYSLQFSLAANPIGFPGPNSFSAVYGGRTLLSFNNLLGALPLTRYSYRVQAESSSDRLDFNFQQDPAFWYLSDILFIYDGPSIADTNQSLVNTAAVLQGTFTLQNSVMVNSFTYDCPVFDKHGVCVSAGGRNTTVQAEGINNTNALLIASYRLDANNSRIGAYADQNLSTQGPGTVRLGNNTPMLGLFGVWAQRPDSIGAEVKVSAAYGQKSTTITRQVVGSSEPGTGGSNLISQGAQLVGKYGFGVMDNVIVSPYAGVRYTQNNMGGYTEASSATVTAPLTYGALNTNATTAIAGAEAKYKGIPQTTLFASAGVETDTNTANGSYNASNASIGTLTPVNFNPNPVKTRPTASVGAYYDIEKNQRLGITGIYRQEPFQAVSTTTVMATYTVGL